MGRSENEIKHQALVAAKYFMQINEAVFPNPL